VTPGVRESPPGAPPSRVGRLWPAVDSAASAVGCGQPWTAGLRRACPHLPTANLESRPSAAFPQPLGQPRCAAPAHTAHSLRWRGPIDTCLMEVGDMGGGLRTSQTPPNSPASGELPPRCADRVSTDRGDEDSSPELADVSSTAYRDGGSSPELADVSSTECGDDFSSPEFVDACVHTTASRPYPDRWSTRSKENNNHLARCHGGCGQVWEGA